MRFLFLFFSFLVGKEFCAVSQFSPLINCRKGITFRINSTKKLFKDDCDLKIFVHSSVRPNEVMKLTQEQVNGKKLMFSGNEFVLLLKDDANLINKISFQQPSTIVLNKTGSSNIINSIINPKAIVAMQEGAFFQVREYLEVSSSFISNVTSALTRSECRINITEGNLSQIDISELSYTLYSVGKIVTIDCGFHKNVDIQINKNLSFIIRNTKYIAQTPNLHLKDNNISVEFHFDEQEKAFKALKNYEKGIIDSNKEISLISPEKHVLDKVRELFDIEGDKIKFLVQKECKEFCFFSKEITYDENCLFIKVDREKTVYADERSELLSFRVLDKTTDLIRVNLNSFECKNITIKSEAYSNIVLLNNITAVKNIDITNIKLIVNTTMLDLDNFVMNGMSEISFKEFENNTLPVLRVKTLSCFSDTDFFDDVNLTCNVLILNTYNTKSYTSVDQNAAKKFVFVVDDSHEINRIFFNENSCKFSFSDKNTIILSSKIISKTLFVAKKQEIIIILTNLCPCNFSIPYSPNIKFATDKDIFWAFDSSWRTNLSALENKIAIGTEKGRNIIIRSKTEREKIENLFVFKNVVWENSTEINGRYCISDDRSKCSEDETYIPYYIGCLTGDFESTYCNELFLHIACDDAVISLSQIENANVHIYSFEYKRATLTFSDSVYINSLEISFVILNIETNLQSNIININNFYSELGYFHVKKETTTIIIKSFIRISFFNAIECLHSLVIYNNVDLEIINHKEFPHLSKIFIDESKICFQLNSTDKFIYNTLDYNHVSFIQYVKTKTKISIYPAFYYSVVIANIPDIYISGEDTYIVFHQTWDYLAAFIKSKGKFAVKSDNKIIILSKKLVPIPELFQYSKEPEIITYNNFDEKICLYNDKISNCPPNYATFRYKRRQVITRKYLGIYGDSITFFIADSNTFCCPILGSDMSYLKYIYLVSNEEQFAQIELLNEISNIILTNVSLFTKKVTETATIKTLMLNENSNITGKDIKVKVAFAIPSVVNSINTFVTHESRIFVKSDSSKITFFNNSLLIGDSLINVPHIQNFELMMNSSFISTFYDHIFISQIRIYCPPNSVIKFIDNTTKAAPNDRIIFKSHKTLSIIGKNLDFVSFDAPTVKQFNKFCIAANKEECPTEYQHIYPDDDFLIENEYNYTEILSLVSNASIKCNRINSSHLVLQSPKESKIKITSNEKKFFQKIKITNVTVSLSENIFVNEIDIIGRSMFYNKQNVLHTFIDYENLFYRKEILQNVYQSKIVSIKMPKEFNKLEIRKNCIAFNADKEFRTDNDARVHLILSSDYLSITCTSKEVYQTPDISMHKGTVIFNNDWKDVVVKSQGILNGVVEVNVENEMPKDAFIHNNKIKENVAKEIFCFYKTDEAASFCSDFSYKFRYSAVPYHLHGKKNVSIFVIDSTKEEPLNLVSHTSFESLNIVSMEDNQFVHISINNCSKLSLSSVNCTFITDTTVDLLNLTDSTVEEANGAKIFIKEATTKTIEVINNIQNINCSKIIYDNENTKGISLQKEGITLYSRNALDYRLGNVKPFIIIAYNNFNILADATMKSGDEIGFIPNIITKESVEVNVLCDLSLFKAKRRGFIKATEGKVKVVFVAKEIQNIFDILDN